MRDGLAITVVSAVACWVAVVTVSNAWGARQVDTAIQFTSALGVLVTGLAVWLGADATWAAD